MTSKIIHIAGQPYTLKEMTIGPSSRESLEAEAALIFGLFLEREKSFGFNPAVVTEYPEIAPPEHSPFLNDPVRYVAARCDAAAGGTPIGKVVILTTYADRLFAPLVEAGYQPSPIDMPAGPDNTAAFTYELTDQPGPGRTLYLEAVNEADEKIRPTFVLELLDEAGRIQGGACGSIHERDGQRYAYLATLAVTPNLPPTSGTHLAREMLRFLAEMGVDTIHLGTQTAGPFYQKLGFRISHRLIPGLRHRAGKVGQVAVHDLVMMTMDIPRA